MRVDKDSHPGQIRPLSTSIARYFPPSALWTCFSRGYSRLGEGRLRLVPDPHKCQGEMALNPL